jgi:uncharacterized cupin superfamily protein
MSARRAGLADLVSATSELWRASAGRFGAMENIYATDWDAVQEEPGYGWSRIRLARRLGGELLGASVYVLAPGQKSFPYHFHHANEEMLIVVEGEVTVRTPDGESLAGPGDALAFTRGRRGAHQVRNDSGSDARVLIISTMVEPDIAEYPDSGKFGLFAGSPPGGSGKRSLETFLDGRAELGYFDGE